MKRIVCIIAVLIAPIIISSCAYHSIKSETGREINEQQVSLIEDGKTSSGEILAWFGAPTTTSKLGSDELFVYKFCKNKGGSFALPGLGQTNTKEYCNELTITLDTASGHVKGHSYQKQIQ